MALHTTHHRFELRIPIIVLTLDLRFEFQSRFRQSGLLERPMSAGRRTADRVRAHLAAAAQAVEALERDIRSGTIDPDQARALEAALFSAVLNAPELAELTLTRAPAAASAPTAPSSSGEKENGGSYLSTACSTATRAGS